MSLLFQTLLHLNSDNNKKDIKIKIKPLEILRSIQKFEYNLDLRKNTTDHTYDCTYLRKWPGKRTGQPFSHSSLKESSVECDIKVMRLKQHLWFSYFFHDFLCSGHIFVFCWLLWRIDYLWHELRLNFFHLFASVAYNCKCLYYFYLIDSILYDKATDSLQLLGLISCLEIVAIAKQSVNFDTRWSKDAKNNKLLSNVMNSFFYFLNETISIWTSVHGGEYSLGCLFQFSMLGWSCVKWKLFFRKI